MQFYSEDVTTSFPEFSPTRTGRRDNLGTRLILTFIILPSDASQLFHPTVSWTYATERERNLMRQASQEFCLIQPSAKLHLPF